MSVGMKPVKEIHFKTTFTQIMVKHETEDSMTITFYQKAEDVPAEDMPGIYVMHSDVTFTALARMHPSVTRIDEAINVLQEVRKKLTSEEGYSEG